jgi:PTS system galactitol-specific IIC component
MVDAIIEKIPGLRDIHFSTDGIQKKFGAFGEPVVVGFLMGIAIGVLAGYDLQNILHLAVKTAAVMLLMPRVIKPIMDGLNPIAKQARSRLQSKFGGEDYLIGLDPALLLGQTNVVSASLLFIPLTIFIAVLLPGNAILPFGDLATIGFFVAMGVAVHNGNLFRAIISGSVIMTGTLWIATQTIPYLTQLGQATGHVSGDKLIGSLDQGGAPITYILIQLFKLENLGGLIVIGGIYAVAVAMTWARAKKYEKSVKEENSLEEAKA